MANYLLTLCIQKETDVEIINKAGEIAQLSNEHVTIDFRDGRPKAIVFPDGTVSLGKEYSDIK